MSALSPVPPPPPPPPPTLLRRTLSMRGKHSVDRDTSHQEHSKQNEYWDDDIDNNKPDDDKDGPDECESVIENSLNSTDITSTARQSSGLFNPSAITTSHPTYLRNGSSLSAVIPSGASSVSSTSGSTTSTGKSTSVSAFSLQQQYQQSKVATPTPSPQLECDYDQSPTPLYLAIEGKQWSVVIEMLENDADDDRRTTSKRSFPMSPKQQASCWVVRKEKDGRLRWRLLPIHAAIIFDASATVIEALLEAYPASAFQKDDQGMLPLHLAFRNITLLLTDTAEKNKVNNRSQTKRGGSGSAAANLIDGGDASRPCAALSSTCQSSSSTAVNWLIVEELLTAFPHAIFSRDRKGRTPVQGGLFAAQQALKSEAKLNKNSMNTPNQRKMAALKVLELYAQIAVAGEKCTWSKENLQKTNQRLAAIAEQHAYRLQEFQVQFLREQTAQKELHKQQLAEAKEQQEALKQENDILRGDIISSEMQLQMMKSSCDQKKAQEQEQIIQELRKQNLRLRNQVVSLTTSLRNTSLALQQTALDNEMMIEAYEDPITGEDPITLSDCSTSASTPTTSQIVSEDILPPNIKHQTSHCSNSDDGVHVENADIESELEKSDEFKSAASGHMRDGEVVSILSSAVRSADATEDVVQVDTSHRRQLSSVSTSSLTRFFGIAQQEDNRERTPRSRSSSINIIATTEGSDIDLAASVGRAQTDLQQQEYTLKDHSSVHIANRNIADGRVDSRDEDLEEDSNSASRKQDSTEDENDGDTDIVETSSSNSLSFEELKKEILGHTVPERVSNERKPDSKSVVFDSVIKKQRILPLITIRSDDERDMIATVFKQYGNNPPPQSSKSQCSMMSSSASNGFADVVGASCVADSFFMSSDLAGPLIASPERIASSGSNYNSGTKNSSQFNKQKSQSDSRRHKRHSLPDPRQIKSASLGAQHSKTCPLSLAGANQIISVDISQSPLFSTTFTNGIGGGEKAILSQSSASSSSTHATKKSRCKAAAKTKTVTQTDDAGSSSNGGGGIGVSSTTVVGTCTTSAVGTSNCSRSLLDTEDDE